MDGSVLWYSAVVLKLLRYLVLSFTLLSLGANASGQTQPTSTAKSSFIAQNGGVRVQPAFETARREGRVLFENDAVVLFHGKRTSSLIADATAYGSLFCLTKAKKAISRLNSVIFGKNPSFLEAVAGAKGQLAFIRAQVQISALNQDTLLFRVDLSSGVVTTVISAAKQKLAGISSLRLSPDEKSLVFLGARAEPRPCPKSSSTPCDEPYAYVSVGYHLILGDYGNPIIRSPRGTGMKLSEYRLDPSVSDGVPCFDAKNKPSTCQTSTRIPR